MIKWEVWAGGKKVDEVDAPDKATAERVARERLLGVTSDFPTSDHVDRHKEAGPYESITGHPADQLAITVRPAK